MATTIRQAAIDDADLLAEIIAEVVAEPEPVIFERALSPDEVRAWLERLRDGGAIFVIADVGRLLAFAAIEPIADAPGECSLGTWVRPAHRRQGHGTDLAEAALSFASEHEYKRIRGQLPEGNEPALSYLSAIGALVPLTNPGSSFILPVE
jgi:RimJ/RimL family protein N-acetyltransferase